MFWIFGVYFSHSILTLLEYDSEKEKLRNQDRALMAAQRFANWSKTEPQKTHALYVVGRLHEYDEEHVQALAELLDSELITVNNQAAWALGELGRHRSWSTGGKGIYRILLSQLQEPLASDTFVFVVEAIAKVFLSSDHSTEESLEIVRALNHQLSYHDDVPPIIYKIKSRIETLDVLILLLDEAIEQVEKNSSASGSPRQVVLPKSQVKNRDGGRGGSTHALDLLHRSSLDLLRYLELHRNSNIPLEKLKLAYRVLLSTLSIEDESLNLFVLWYVGRLADQEQVSNFISEQLISQGSWEDEISISGHLLRYHSLIQLVDAQVSREFLRSELIKAEEHEDLLSFLSQSFKGKQDLIQMLYHIRPEEEHSKNVLRSKGEGVP